MEGKWIRFRRSLHSLAQARSIFITRVGQDNPMPAIKIRFDSSQHPDLYDDTKILFSSHDPDKVFAEFDSICRWLQDPNGAALYTAEPLQ